MHLVLPDQNAPTRVILGDSQPLSDDEFFDFCMANPDLRIERRAQGEIVIVGSSVCFLLPDGSGLSPDTAWVDNSKLAALSKGTRKKFLPVVPDFVIEVMSPSDRLKLAQEKMQQWIANGTGLAWLIDGDNRTIYVYRPGQACSCQTDIQHLEAGPGGPVDGFVADFADVWEGL
jgi:Uma2 family endonuclease